MYIAAGIAQSVQRLATGWTARGSNNYTSSPHLCLRGLF